MEILSDSKAMIQSCEVDVAEKESPKLLSPMYVLSDFSLSHDPALSKHLYSMNALEILRETIRILRLNSSIFFVITTFLICPLSAFLLSNILVKQSIVKAIMGKMLLVAHSSGLPLNKMTKQSCQRLAEMAVSYVFCFPFFITFSLVSKVSIVYSVACTYAGKEIIPRKFISAVINIWKNVISTYLWICMVQTGCLVLFLMILVLVCNIFFLLMFPPEVIVYPALILAVVFAVCFAHTTIVCNLATVISVLEEVSGPQALFRSVFLIRGQTHVGLLIFLGSTIGMTFVEGLFEHRVKTLSYGDGSSRIWEGPLLVIMYSLVVLVDSMMSAVFYFTCRSSSIELVDDEGQNIAEPEILSPDFLN